MSLVILIGSLVATERSDAAMPYLLVFLVLMLALLVFMATLPAKEK